MNKLKQILTLQPKWYKNLKNKTINTNNLLIKLT
jgi:hypothetical protein